VFAWALAGFLAMFFIERFFCFHHHDVPPVEGEQGAAEPHRDHGEDGGACGAIDGEAHRLSWTGAAVGLTLHTIIAGIALAASVEAESGGGHVAALAGLGTFLVVFLHKPFDAMTITTLMTVGDWSRTARHLVNGLFALMIPVGVLLFYLGLAQTHAGSHLVAYALAFSAGTFLCISTSDLLPELQFHRHDRAALSGALLLGLAVAWVIGIIETQGHGHGHGHHEHAPAAESHPHGHDAGEEPLHHHEHDAEAEHAHDHHAESEPGHDQPHPH
jgi:zinc and cadmium transporter